jgi:hypothetical protein
MDTISCLLCYSWRTLTAEDSAFGVGFVVTAAIKQHQIGV